MRRAPSLPMVCPMSKNWPKSKPFLVGITGGIGAGKSLVSALLELLRVPVYYADQRARALMQEDPALGQSIRDLLGEEAYADGRLNRPFISRKVFHDEALRRELEALVHPVVRSDFERWRSLHSHAPILAREAAILIESGAWRDMDAVVIVSAPAEVRIERVMRRDGTSRKEVQARMAAQWSDEQRRPYGTHEVVNDGAMAVIPQVLRLYEQWSGGSIVEP